MIPSRAGLVALSLVACGEVAPVSLSGDAGASLLTRSATGVRADASAIDAAASELPDASDVTSAGDASSDTLDAATADASDVAPHVCGGGVYPIAFSCLDNLPGCSPCVGGVACCQLDAY